MAYEYKTLVVETRQSAELLKATVLKFIQTYGLVSVGDLYELAGTARVLVDYKFGWTNLNADEIKIVKVRNGFTLDFPYPMLFGK